MDVMDNTRIHYLLFTRTCIERTRFCVKSITSITKGGDLIS